jgi:hypothetical protein
MVSWAAFADGERSVQQGEVATFNSSGAARRSFCARCGTGLFYHNAEMLPGIVDIQSATLDDPEALPPQLHIQVAERLAWMDGQEHLPAFARFPSQD